jgi:hypothetical protein
MHSRNRAGFDHSNSDLPDCHQELDSSNHISLPKAKHPGSFTLECFVAIARFFILCFLTVPGLLPCDSDFSVKRKAWNRSIESRMGKLDGGGTRLLHNLYGRFFLCPVISRETEILRLEAPTRQLIKMRMGTWWGCKNLARAKMVDEGCEFACPFCTDDPVDDGTDDAVPETALHAVLNCPAWTLIRTKHIGEAIGDIRERLGVLQEVLGDTVLEEDVMIFRGLLGGQPGDDIMLPYATIFQGSVVSQKKMCGESPLSSHTASFLRLFSRFIPSLRLLPSLKEFFFAATFRDISPIPGHYSVCSPFAYHLSGLRRLAKENVRRVSALFAYCLVPPSVLPFHPIFEDAVLFERVHFCRPYSALLRLFSICIHLSGLLRLAKENARQICAIFAYCLVPPSVLPFHAIFQASVVFERIHFCRPYRLATPSVFPFRPILQGSVASSS